MMVRLRIHVVDMHFANFNLCCILLLLHLITQIVLIVGGPQDGVILLNLDLLEGFHHLL